MNYNLTFGRHNFRRIVLIGVAVIVLHALPLGAIVLTAIIVTAGVSLYRWSNELRPVQRPEPFDYDGDESVPQGWSGRDMS